MGVWLKDIINDQAQPEYRTEVKLYEPAISMKGQICIYLHIVRWNPESSNMVHRWNTSWQGASYNCSAYVGLAGILQAKSFVMLYQKSDIHPDIISGWKSNLDTVF